MACPWAALPNVSPRQDDSAVSSRSPLCLNLAEAGRTDQLIVSPVGQRAKQAPPRACLVPAQRERKSEPIDPPEKCTGQRCAITGQSFPPLPAPSGELPGSTIVQDLPQHWLSPPASPCEATSGCRGWSGLLAVSFTLRTACARTCPDITTPHLPVLSTSLFRSPDGLAGHA